jgi:hypothetical protein
MLLLSRSAEQEEQVMPQTRTFFPFLAAMPGVDDRILRDVGLNAEGNFVDKDDPRVRRLGRRRRFVEQLLARLSSRGTMLLQRSWPAAASADRTTSTLEAALVFRSISRR